MKLLTQEEGAKLRAGDVVNVYWFSPRKPKGEEPPSRQWDGRQEWVSSVDKNQVVKTDARLTANDGWAVTLEGTGPWLRTVAHMEKVDT